MPKIGQISKQLDSSLHLSNMERDDPLSPGGGTPSGPPTFTGVPPQQVEVSSENGVGNDGVPPQVDDNSMSGTPLSSTSFGAASRNG